MGWEEPKENSDLRKVIKDSLEELKEDGKIFDFAVSIRVDRMYAEIFCNKELIIREFDEVPDGDFDDILMERNLLKRMLTTALRFTINSLLEND